MKAEKFGFWFRRITKILVPFSFLLIAILESKPLGYALAGIMSIVVIFAYVLEGAKIGDKKS